LRLRSVGGVENPEILCTVFSDKKMSLTDKSILTETLSWTLGTNEDLKGFYSFSQRDSLVKALAEDLYGMRDTNRPDFFPMLTLALTLQMAPMKRSSQMMDLLIREYGSSVIFDEKEILYWPSPQTIAKASVKELEQKCKLGYRAKHLKSIAQYLCKGFPTYIELSKMPAKEAKAKLMKLRGIGEYSADIVSPHSGFPLDVWSARIFNLLLFKKEPEKSHETIPILKEKACGRKMGRMERLRLHVCAKRLGETVKKVQRQPHKPATAEGFNKDHWVVGERFRLLPTHG